MSAMEFTAARDIGLGAEDALRKGGTRAETTAPGPVVSFVVATANRTTGAVICNLLEGAGRATRWMLRRKAEAELAAGGIFPCDILLMEVADAEAAKTVGAARGAAGPALIAVAADGGPELRAACEKAGFDGCVAAPVEPGALAELTNAIMTRVDGAQENGEGRGATALGQDAGGGVIDMRALEDLAGLGGKDFVRDIIVQFIEDAASLLRALQETIRNGDASAFRDQAHALRSCAANVGASGVYAKCLALRSIESQELAEHGDGLMLRLEAEVAQARDALQAYLERQ
jgi:two-component system, sensor histidine kinase RpfC